MSKAERDSWKLAIAWALYVIGERTEKGLSPTFDSSLAEAEALRRYPDKPLANVREILVDCLKNAGLDGLHSGDRCQCLIGEWPLGGAGTCTQCGDCRPGVLVDGKIVPKESRDA